MIPDRALPKVIDLDVETDEGHHVAVLAPFARWDDDVAVYVAIIAPELAARTTQVTARGIRCNTEIRLGFLGGDDGD